MLFKLRIAVFAYSDWYHVHTQQQTSFHKHIHVLSLPYDKIALSVAMIKKSFFLIILTFFMCASLFLHVDYSVEELDSI